MEKISKEVATREVEGWLDFKKVSEVKREQKKPFLDNLIGYVMEGTLVLKEDKTFVHTLKFEIGEGSTSIKTLEYKPRINMQQVRAQLQGVKSEDGEARLAGYVAVLTSQNSGIMKALDTEDNSVAESIAVFFL